MKIMRGCILMTPKKRMMVSFKFQQVKKSLKVQLSRCLNQKNVIDPQSIIQSYADSARWFMLSDSPPEKDINWSEAGINGAWKICQKFGQ